MSEIALTVTWCQAEADDTPAAAQDVTGAAA
jgi:hypothetical protein